MTFCNRNYYYYYYYYKEKEKYKLLNLFAWKSRKENSRKKERERIFKWHFVVRLDHEMVKNGSPMVSFELFFQLLNEQFLLL